MTDIVERLRHLSQRIPQDTTAGKALREGIAEIERLRSPWVSVEERLPDESVVVICYCPQFRYEVCMGEYSDKHWHRPGPVNTTALHVTHWMPLPTPPGKE